MKLLNKLLGLSKIQEEFRKSVLLKIPLIISSVDNIEVRINKKSLNLIDGDAVILFDFLSNQLIIEGFFFDEIISENTFFVTDIKGINETPTFYFTKINSSDIIMKCIVNRSSISFESTKEDWSFSIFDEFKISH